MKTNEELFDVTKQKLETKGYKFKSDTVSNNSYKSEAGELFVWIFEPTYEEVHPYFNAKILAEPKACFDKITRCSLVLDFPKNEKEQNWLIEKLKFLETNAGEEFAATFGEIKNYPENL